MSNAHQLWNDTFLNAKRWNALGIWTRHSNE